MRTWSFAREISGEMTIVKELGWLKGGSWKHRDLPPPVGSTSSTSKPCVRKAVLYHASCWQCKRLPAVVAWLEPRHLESCLYGFKLQGPEAGCVPV